MHICPECGETCMCNDDIEDVDWGEVEWCEHWKICQQETEPEDEGGVDERATDSFQRRDGPRHT